MSQTINFYAFVLSKSLKKFNYWILSQGFINLIDTSFSLSLFFLSDHIEDCNFSDIGHILTFHGRSKKSCQSSQCLEVVYMWKRQAFTMADRVLFILFIYKLIYMYIFCQSFNSLKKDESFIIFLYYINT